MIRSTDICRSKTLLSIYTQVIFLCINWYYCILTVNNSNILDKFHKMTLLCNLTIFISVTVNSIKICIRSACATCNWMTLSLMVSSAGSIYLAVTRSMRDRVPDLPNYLLKLSFRLATTYTSCRISQPQSLITLSITYVCRTSSFIPR
jgi:hypothetical protein